jgi:DDE family transposase
VRRPRPAGEPVHLPVDSTGLRLCGPGEWLVAKHGGRTRRSWKKLHLATDADTGRIVASALTDHDGDDGAQVGPLLDRIEGPVASFTADGAYDRGDVPRFNWSSQRQLEPLAAARQRPPQAFSSQASCAAGCSAP